MSSLISALMGPGLLCQVCNFVIVFKKKFMVIAESYWMDEENRRWFFTSIAKKLAFDYKVPENWYSITSNTISSFQVFVVLVAGMVMCYNISFRAPALFYSFIMEIGLKPLLPFSPTLSWTF